MGIEISRLTKNDYDELISVLDRTFTKYHNVANYSFEENIPKMCRRTDEAMNKHFALRRDGSIKSVLGVYPLPVRIAGEEMLFSTVGNVATLPEEEGKGYMSLLLDVAMQELKDIGADASRLGGNRSRYRRYGYDPAGSMYTYTLELKQWPKDILTEKIVFKPLLRQDEELINEAAKIHGAGSFIVIRSTMDDFYDTLCAWKNIPYVAFNNDGKMIGYLSASADGGSIVELEAYSFKEFQTIIYGWLSQRSSRVTMPMMAHRIIENDFLLDICADYTITSPSRFKFINWEKVIYATLKLKATYTPMPKTEKLIEISGYGKLLIITSDSFVKCIRCNDFSKTADITLPWHLANMFFFGPSPELANRLGCGGLFPLPLSWNKQDRV